MGQPLYFLPNIRAAQCETIPLRNAMLRERGLTDIFTGCGFDQMPCWELPGRGPGDLSGCLLTYQTPAGAVPRRLGYYPAEQAWTPVGDGSQVWIGVDTAEPPKPEEMARRKQFNGYHIECGDGNKWLVPVIRRPDGTTELPRDMVYDAGGKYGEPIKAAYVAYWEEIAEFAQWYYGDQDPGGFSRERGLKLATRALSLNYRFGPAEQNVLRIIDADCYLMILFAAVDAPAWTDIDAAQKKMNGPPGTRSITPGQPAGSLTTDLAMANSS